MIVDKNPCERVDIEGAIKNNPYFSGTHQNLLYEHLMNGSGLPVIDNE